MIKFELNPFWDADNSAGFRTLKDSRVRSACLKYSIISGEDFAMTSSTVELLPDKRLFGSWDNSRAETKVNFPPLVTTKCSRIGPNTSSRSSDKLSFWL